MNLWSVLQSDEKFNREAINWEELGKLLVEHKLAGYFFNRWPDLAPPETRSLLRTQWAAQRLRNEIHIQEFEAIRDVFKKMGLTAIGLKGVVLTPILYPDLGSRFMSDIDILVSGASEDDICAALGGFGYTRIPEKKWWANDFKLSFAKESAGLDLTVEVHTKLFAKEPKDFQWIQDPEEPRALTPNQNLVHLCGHLAYQHSFLKAFWLLDVDLFIRAYQYRLEWPQITELAARLGLERSLASSLAYARNVLGTPIPSEIKVSSIVERLIEQNFESERSPLWSRYVLKHLVKDSWSEAIDYDLGWVKNRLFGKDDSKDEPPST